MEIALNNWINSLNTTSSLDIRVAPATRTRGEGGLRPPSPLVLTIIVWVISSDVAITGVSQSTTIAIISGLPLPLRISTKVINYHCNYSRTWIVSTLKGRKNKYSISDSEVLTIQGAFNGFA